MKKTLHILLIATLALSAQLLLSACAHDVEEPHTTNQLDLPVATRAASQTQAE